MKTLSYSEFINLLRKGGARPVGILATTDAGARKTGNPFGTILKRLRAVGFVGASYERAVQKEGTARQGAYEADGFKADSLPWGQWVEGLANKVITHKGEYYLRTQSTPGQRNRQPARVLAYLSQAGVKLDPAKVKPFLPEDKGSARQEAVGMTGKENQVAIRTYKFSSIERVRINGETYRLVKS